MPNQKLKLIYLSRIFEERTDRYHGLTLPEISSALGEYGISAENRIILRGAGSFRCLPRQQN